MHHGGQGGRARSFVFSAPGEMRVEKMTAARDVLARSCRGNGELKERNRFMPLMSQKVVFGGSSFVQRL